MIQTKLSMSSIYKLSLYPRQCILAIWTHKGNDLWLVLQKVHIGKFSNVHETMSYWLKLKVDKKTWTWKPRISNSFEFFQVFFLSFDGFFNPRCGFLEEKYYFPWGELCCYLSWIMRGLILSQTPALLSHNTFADK